MVWQTYGLINAADAVLLLRHGGHVPPPGAQAALRAWLRTLAEAVNSGLHAWTRWAQENAESGVPAFHRAPAQGDAHAAALLRHRADNHLSWALAGLLAGAIALEDDALADHALNGGVWRDRRAGARANPSFATAVIDAAIEGGVDAGRIFEDRIARSPPIGYALFHLEALSLIARMAALHRHQDLWSATGADGAGMAAAFTRYAPYLRGDLASSSAAENPVRGRWLFALSPPGFGGAGRAALLAAAPVPAQMRHAIGPAALLFR
jgi:hypothetical protein